MRTWRADNAAKVSEYHRRDREKNRLRIRAYNRVWGRAKRPKGPGVPRGERNGAARLTATSAVQLRCAYEAGGVTIAELARRFGVSQTGAWKVIRRVTWDHVA